MNVARYLETHPSKQFLAVIIAFVVGIGLHSLRPFDVLGGGRIFLFAAAVFGLAVLIFGWRRLALRFPALIFLAIIFGFLRFDYFADHSAKGNIVSWNGGAPVRLEGMVAAPPEIRESYQRVIVETKSVGSLSAKGRILVRAPLEPRYKYGDILRVSCRLDSPKVIRGFDESRALLPSRIFSVCNRSDDITLLLNRGHSWARDVYKISDAFLSGLRRALPEPQASLAAGLILGERRLPKEVVVDFQSTGTSHIVAVSGYNISIITVFIFSLLGLIFIPRRLALLVTILILIMFVLATGGSPSVIRAAIMGLLPFIGQSLGRPTQSMNALLFTGFCMLLINPALLIFDIGFQLSFAAMVGLIVLGPAIVERFGWQKETGFHLVDHLRSAGVQTISAIIMTLPILLTSFGRVSLVAPLANLLVLFAIPWAMLASFAAGVLAPIVGSFSFLIAAPADLLLRYILEVARLFSSIPWSNITIGRISPLSSFLLYLAIAIPFFVTKRRVVEATSLSNETSDWTIMDDKT